MCEKYGVAFSTQIINIGVVLIKNIYMTLKIVVFRPKNIDFGAKFGKNYKHGSKNHPFRITNMGHVSEASAAHPYQKSEKLTATPTQPELSKSI